jgi:hypothetical protein
MTTLRVLDSIDGIEPDRFLPLLKKWIDVRLQIFQIMNRNNLEKPIH